MAGLSHGFLVFDDTGSEWTRAGETFTLRLFPNRFVYSREQNRASAPYFTIELGPDDRQPPAAPSGLRVEPETALLPAGEALVSWVTPRDDGPAGTLGFFVTLDGRDAAARADPAGRRARRAGRDAPARPEALRPAATVKLCRAGRGWGRQSRTGGDSRHHGLEPRPRAPAPAQAGARNGARPPRLHCRASPAVEVAILDELDKVHPVDRRIDSRTSPRATWPPIISGTPPSRTITLQAARNEFVAFQVLLAR